MSKESKKMIKSIEKYMESSMKKEYKFTLEEQITIQRAIESLLGHIGMLIDYEIKRESE